MKKILVPVSFSKTSESAMRYAHIIANQYGATLSLLHCYPSQSYNREYDFGKEDYDKGIRKMLKVFYNKSIANDGSHRYNIVTFSGSVSTIISKISRQYDLMVICRKTGFQTISKRYFSDKLFIISTSALCPVLIMSTTQKEFSLKESKNIWHIQRNEGETKTLLRKLDKFGIDPKLIVTKSFSQKSFISEFWKGIVTYTKTHKKELLKNLSKSFEEEQINLLILVNRLKGKFEIFMKDDAFQIISQFDIPILILQPKKSDT